MAADAEPGRRPAGAIGYVLKGFPRLSEIFIASEIERVEAAGLPVRLFVLKPGDDAVRHPVIDRIKAEPVYIPHADPVSDVALARWLIANLPRFGPALRRTIRRRPNGFARAAAAAVAQAVRARESRWAMPRKVYVKELLQATAVADMALTFPDVRHLHAHFCHGATTVAWLAATIAGLPFSFTAHAKDLYSPALNPAGLIRRKLAAARFAVTCTEANRAVLKRSANGTPVHRIYHGLNTDFSRLLEQAGPRQAPNGTLRLLTVGRLVRKKGLDVFVEACALLAARGVPLQATIIGEDGPEAGDLRLRIASHGLEARVAIRGPVGQSELFREYRGATIFSLPCRVADDGDRDGIPNVLMEAMACGVPVVTTDVSGIPELIQHGTNGLLVPPDDPRALASAMQRLFDDRQLACRIAASGANTVRERFDGDVLAAQLVAIFSEAVDR